MKEFQQLCKEFENMDARTYRDALSSLSARVLPALSALTMDGVSGLLLFSSFLLGATAADGKLSEEEYLAAYPLFAAFFGPDISYEECAKLFRQYKSEGKDLKRLVDNMVDMLGELSEDLKNDIVLICLLICAVDGKVSRKEKSWIRQLIR